MTDTPSRFDRVRGLREVLTATGAGIYLATHRAGPLPAETLAAVHESDDLELRVGRFGPDREEDLAQRDREARAVVAAVLQASPERLVLTHGASEAARLVALEVLERGAGQRVLLAPGTDRVIAAAVRDVADVAGAPVEVLDEQPSAIAQDVALVVATHVDADGRLADIAATAGAVGSSGAKRSARTKRSAGTKGSAAAEDLPRPRLLVDVSRSVGARPVDVSGLGADFVIGDVHRWLLGPESVAFLWITPELDVELPEWLRHACAPFARGQLLALARSVGWLLMYVELPWALDRTLALADQLYESLAEIDGVELLADPSAHGAVASFRLGDWGAETAAEELGRSIFAIIEADPEADVIRASVGAWNRERELERFTDRVAELAAHTPQTLPRRPSLTVISGPPEPGDVE